MQTFSLSGFMIANPRPPTRNTVIMLINATLDAILVVEEVTKGREKGEGRRKGIAQGPLRGTGSLPAVTQVLAQRVEPMPTSCLSISCQMAEHEYATSRLMLR